MHSVLFDFDGTIADSFAVIVSIANRVSSDFGARPVTDSDIERYRNLSTQQIMSERDVSLVQIPRMLRRVRAELREEMPKVEPFPGIIDALTDMKEHQGCYLGILTSNAEENVSLFLERHQMAHLFEFVHSKVSIFGKARTIRYCLKHYHLDRSRTIYVGDEVRDIEASRKAGVKAIAVSWGFNGTLVLNKSRPDALVSDPRALVEATMRLSSNAMA